MIIFFNGVAVLLHWPFFHPIFSYWVGLKWIWIIRSVETELRRRTPVVAVINVDAYLIFGFLKPDLSLWGYKNRCFLVALLWLILKRHIWEKATKSFFPSAVTNTRVVLVPCRAWKCVPTASFSGMDILEVTGCYLLKQMSSQCHKNCFKDQCLKNSHSTFPFLPLLIQWKDQKYINQVTLNHTAL